MADFSAFNFRNPGALLGALGERLRTLRLAKGWSQQELAERAGLAVSTLKQLEAKGEGSLQRLVRVAIALGVDGELRDLFARSQTMESIEAVKLSERQRAPRRKRKEGGDGAAG